MATVFQANVFQSNVFQVVLANNIAAAVGTGAANAVGRTITATIAAASGAGFGSALSPKQRLSLLIDPYARVIYTAEFTPRFLQDRSL